jgi:hypothetical protein
MVAQPTGARDWGRIFRLLLVSAPLLTLLLTALASGSAEAGLREPKVICIERYGNNPTGSYRYKPRKCVFHHRGEFPVAGVNTASTSSLHWRRWGPRRAKGRGKIGISTVGEERVKVTLTRPRFRCGVTVFTHAKFRIRIRFGGETHRDTFGMPLDNCLT